MMGRPPEAFALPRPSWAWSRGGELAAGGRRHVWQTVPIRSPSYLKGANVFTSASRYPRFRNRSSVSRQAHRAVKYTSAAVVAACKAGRKAADTVGSVTGSAAGWSFASRPIRRATWWLMSRHYMSSEFPQVHLVG
jgi:hypothetical protein